MHFKNRPIERFVFCRIKVDMIKFTLSIVLSFSTKFVFLTSRGRQHPGPQPDKNLGTKVFRIKSWMLSIKSICHLLRHETCQSKWMLPSKTFLIDLRIRALNAVSNYCQFRPNLRVSIDLTLCKKSLKNRPFTFSRGCRRLSTVLA